MTKKSLFALAWLAAAAAFGAPMKFCVLQPPYALDPAGIGASVQWELDALAKCDESVDVIVLPEGSDHQGRASSREQAIAAAKKYGAKVVAACAEAARRCNAVVFANVYDFSRSEAPRNTTLAFNRAGEIVGRYDKRHLTRGEWQRWRYDSGYMWSWSAPETVEIDGVRYAFLTCYDFYFYEALANIARYRPDVIIGCSHQRSDTRLALDFFGRFIAYNTGAYLVRSSVSMGEDSPLGGCSMIVAPSGEMLGNLESRAGTLSAVFDPHEKYLKPMGYNGPAGLHADYVDEGRRPWQYRPAGSAIVPPFENAPAKRLCAHRGFSTVAPENSLAAFGAAVALGASEIEFDLLWTKDGEIVSIHDATLERVSDGEGRVFDHTFEELLKYDFGVKKSAHFKGMRILKFADILEKLSCHVIMNIHLKDLGRAWDEALARKVIDLIDAYDARRHVYFMTSNGAVQDQFARLAPDIPRCMGNGSLDNKSRPDIVDRALKHGCRMAQLFKPYFDRALVERAHAAGLRVNVFFADDPEEAKRFLEMGVDTVLTNDYQPISAATGLK